MPSIISFQVYFICVWSNISTSAIINMLTITFPSPVIEYLNVKSQVDGDKFLKDEKVRVCHGITH